MPSFPCTVVLSVRTANLVELEHAGLEADAVAPAALDVGRHAGDRPDARHGERGRLDAAPLDQAPAGVLAVLEPHVARHVEAPAEAPHRLLGRRRRRRSGHRADVVLGRSSPDIWPGLRFYAATTPCSHVLLVGCYSLTIYTIACALWQQVY